MHSIRQFDHRYTTGIRSLPDQWRGSLSAVSLAGEPAVIVLLGVCGFWTSVLRHKPRVWHVFIYAGIAYGINILLKLLLHRKRPHGRVIKTLGIQSYSFPSGHAFGTVLLYGLLAYLASRHLAAVIAGLTVALLFALIFVIGISRVYLGTHYPSDVLAGWLLGGASLAIVISLAFH
jgi:membrane-associated phospholipid phosphatase